MTKECIKTYQLSPQLVSSDTEEFLTSFNLHWGRNIEKFSIHQVAASIR